MRAGSIAPAQRAHRGLLLAPYRGGARKEARFQIGKPDPRRLRAGLDQILRGVIIVETVRSLERDVDAHVLLRAQKPARNFMGYPRLRDEHVLDGGGPPVPRAHAPGALVRDALGALSGAERKNADAIEGLTEVARRLGQADE